jgi:hypothetical protein
MSDIGQSAHTAALAHHPQRTRRIGQRARVSWSVWAQAGPQRMRLHTVDVSARGAKLRPRGAFRIGTAIELEFIKPDGRHLHVSGVVWRVDPDGMAVLFLGTVPQGFAPLAQRS